MLSPYVIALIVVVSLTVVAFIVWFLISIYKKRYRRRQVIKHRLEDERKASFDQLHFSRESTIHSNGSIDPRVRTLQRMHSTGGELNVTSKHNMDVAVISNGQVYSGGHSQPHLTPGGRMIASSAFPKEAQSRLNYAQNDSYQYSDDSDDSLPYNEHYHRQIPRDNLNQQTLPTKKCINGQKRPLPSPSDHLQRPLRKVEPDTENYDEHYYISGSRHDPDAINGNISDKEKKKDRLSVHPVMSRFA